MSLGLTVKVTLFIPYFFLPNNSHAPMPLEMQNLLSELLVIIKSSLLLYNVSFVN